VVVGIIALLISILTPALARARYEGQRITCLSNMRQMGIAAENYAGDFGGSYPLAHQTVVQGRRLISYAWDFTSTKDWDTGGTSVVPGLLWQGKTIAKIHQCPSFNGESNWLEDPYTGYNYNTSYIGHGVGESIAAPAKVTDVRRPGECALFGDGQYASGANKFMRAPWPNPGDESFWGRSSGTQGFRHLRKTNVVFCDGHGESFSKICTETDPFEVDQIAAGTGFLSKDNQFYDLE